MTKVTAAVVGATGYSGQELVRLLARHPGVSLVGAFGSSASDAPRRLPALARLWDGDVQPFAPEAVVGRADAVFLALPEAAAATTAPALADAGIRVFDLSGAFRLRDAALRRRWYPATPDPLPAGTVYGLTEFAQAEIPAARLVSCPGCYPTAALLGLLPLVAARLLDGDPIVDAKSGISGAGKGASERTHFSENHGSVAAYNVFAHRHTPEMEQALGRRVTFVPHLVPLDRGILTTLYARVHAGTDAAAVAAAFARPYERAPFVRLTGDQWPEIKHVVRTNFCDVGWKLDADGERLVVVTVIDNLVKGAAGQAVQNFNLAFGFEETEGLL
ncbi:MAG: N-acetyl-gamma-glutamyl-phosphate reductase [Vicinamibacterales bacterium]|jgi:N-acetyl-gamma-glutamyl-phosphate reductase|nr:N-acetyl-gamma-glutamyl-phosphate reductase [Vicinamibacterales bacterium]